MNPWPLWYCCSALPTELTSQLGAGHYHNVGSCNKPMEWWINDFKYIEIIYVNCGLRNEFGSDLRCNEHYLSSTENKASIFFSSFFPKLRLMRYSFVVVTFWRHLWSLIAKVQGNMHLIFNCYFIIDPLSAFSALTL